MIEGRMLGVRVGQNVLLEGVNVRVPKKQITAIIGPNGSGKSTLMKVLGAFLEASEGEVLCHHQPLAKMSRKDQAACRALVSQAPASDLPFSVRDLVSFGAYAFETRGSTKRHLDALDMVLQQFDLFPLQNRIVATLSGGEQQRVQMAKAVYQLQLADPKEKGILMLDEPANHLDLKYQQDLMHQLLVLKSEGFGVLVVLHDLAQVHQVADELICLKEGRLVACGPPSKVITPAMLHAVFGLSPEQCANHPQWMGLEKTAGHPNQSILAYGNLNHPGLAV